MQKTILFKLFLITLAAAMNACGSLPNGEKWGENITLTPGKARLSSAAYSALIHPSTWGPLSGAVLFSLGDLDNETSENAMENTPVFGSPKNAADRSDDLRNALDASAIITALATPSGQDRSEWTTNKAKGLLFTFATLETTSLVTQGIKDVSKRERPNKQNDKSFPSGHSSGAFAAASLSSRNLDSITMQEWQRTGIRIALYGVAAGTAWARVEAGKHYPSDVLAGAALGNFMANFIHDAFLGLQNDSLDLRIEAYPDYQWISLAWYF